MLSFIARVRAYKVTDPTDTLRYGQMARYGQQVTVATENDLEHLCVVDGMMTSFAQGHLPSLPYSDGRAKRVLVRPPRCVRDMTWRNPSAPSWFDAEFLQVMSRTYRILMIVPDNHLSGRHGKYET